MASNLEAMASNLIAMASPKSDGLQHIERVLSWKWLKHVQLTTWQHDQVHEGTHHVGDSDRSHEGQQWWHKAGRGK